MSERYLPILDAERLIEDPALATWALMNFCGNELDARRATVLISEEKIDIKAGRQKQYSNVARNIQKLMKRGVDHGKLSGTVAIQVYSNLLTRNETNINRAVFSVSEWASVNTKKNGKPISSDASAMRKNFRKYRDVVHLWAAFELLEDEEQESFHSDSSAFEKLLCLSLEFETIFSERNAFPKWNPWRVPPQVVNNMRYDYRFELTKESDWLTEKLSEYSSDIVRT